MHPFRSVYMPNDPAIQDLWPKLGSVFEYCSPSTSPVVPVPQRPSSTKPEIDADEYAGHVDGFWSPFANSCLAQSCGYMNVNVRPPSPSKLSQRLVHHSPTRSAYINVVSAKDLDGNVHIKESKSNGKSSTKRTVTIVVDQGDRDHSQSTSKRRNGSQN